MTFIEVLVASAIIAAGFVFLLTSFHFFSKGQAAKSSFDTGLQFTGDLRSEVATYIKNVILKQNGSCASSAYVFQDANGNAGQINLAGGIMATYVSQSNMQAILQVATSTNTVQDGAAGGAGTYVGQVQAVLNRCVQAPLAPKISDLAKPGLYFCLWLQMPAQASLVQNSLLLHQPLIGEFYVTVIDQASGSEAACPAPLPSPLPAPATNPPPRFASYAVEMISTMHWPSDHSVRALYRSQNGINVLGYF